jgi:hypothetical protein
MLDIPMAGLPRYSGGGREIQNVTIFLPHARSTLLFDACAAGTKPMALDVYMNFTTACPCHVDATYQTFRRLGLYRHLGSERAGGRAGPLHDKFTGRFGDYLDWAMEAVIVVILFLNNMVLVYILLCHTFLARVRLGLGGAGLHGLFELCPTFWGHLRKDIWWNKGTGGCGCRLNFPGAKLDIEGIGLHGGA